MGLFGREDKKKKVLHEDRFYKDGFNEKGNHIDTGNQFDKNGYNKEGLNELTGTLYGENGYDRKGYGENGYNKNGFHIKTKTKFNEFGFDENGIDEKGFNEKGINKSTGTLYDENGLDENGFDENGFDENGFDENGIDENGFDEKGINKSTGTLYDEKGFDSDRLGEDGYSEEGFNEDDQDKNGKYKIEYVKLIASIDSRENKSKLFLDSISGNIHFNMIAFQGEEKFAKMVSGGNFDFYDNDAPAYILNIKFDEINKNLQDTLVSVIRRTFPKKFQIFPSNYSIGAYWINDLITEENASYYLRRIIENYLSR
jgi:hypothetical protein